MNKEYKTIPFKELKQALNQLYNGWFRSWRDVKITGDNWTEVIRQLVAITTEYEDYPVVFAVAEALLKELEERNKHDR